MYTMNTFPPTCNIAQLRHLHLTRALAPTAVCPMARLDLVKLNSLHLLTHLHFSW